MDAFYLDRFCNIIGLWYDMFDSLRYWSCIVPHLSLANKSLQLSILASSSKQHYLTCNEPEDTALIYYNRALQELNYALESLVEAESAAIFASCLLIGYCEMIDARNQDWHTHLAGTFSLRSAQGWHGCSGGLVQSCFWVYCRMDVLASLATAERTRLDTSLWLPEGTTLGPRNPCDEWPPDSWCNNVVLLLAQVNNFLCDVRESLLPPPEHLLREWQSLQTRIAHHERARPLEFRPLIVLPANPDNVDNPFETTIYVAANVCGATQMLDLAHLLLILAYPDVSHAARVVRLTSHDTTLRTNSLVHNIVANSVVNRRPIAWVNAVQLLRSAGLMLVGTSYRIALLKVLADIKRETGWTTQGHMEALREWWGWNDGSRLEDGSLSEVGELLLRAFDISRQKALSEAQPRGSALPTLHTHPTGALTIDDLTSPIFTTRI